MSHVIVNYYLNNNMQPTRFISCQTLAKRSEHRQRRRTLGARGLLVECSKDRIRGNNHLTRNDLSVPPLDARGAQVRKPTIVPENLSRTWEYI